MHCADTASQKRRSIANAMVLGTFRQPDMVAPTLRQGCCLFSWYCIIHPCFNYGGWMLARADQSGPLWRFFSDAAIFQQLVDRWHIDVERRRGPLAQTRDVSVLANQRIIAMGREIAVPLILQDLRRTEA